MTREEKLDWLYRLKSEIFVLMPKEWIKPMSDALGDVIKALEQEPTTKNDLGVDCVSRQFMYDLGATCIATRNENGKLIALGTIEELPSVTQEPIIDKIRAEIEKKIVKRPWLDFEDRERDRNDAFLEMLDIIDKYKAESEG